MSHEIDGFLARVKDRAGQSDVAVVEPAARATLHALGGHLGGLPPVLHDAVPRLLRPVIAEGGDAHALRPAELYQRLAEELGVRVGVALEIVQSTIAELLGSLDEPAIDVLRTSLPPAWAALIPSADDIEREQSRPMRAARNTEGSGMYRLSSEGSGAHRLTEGSGAHKLTEGSGAFKLSGGRPGSSRPLADAQPPAGQPDSIATSDDPHGDHTLAGGRPGSRRSEPDPD
jgi:hypothetical protein